MQSILSSDDIKHILVVRLNKVGDMICTIPLLKTLRHHFKNAKITMLAEKPSAEIFTDTALVDDLIIYTRKHSLLRNRHLEVRKLLMDYKMRSNVKFDVAIGVKGGFSSFLAIIVFLSGAKIRIGYISNKNYLLNWCYNFPVNPIDFSMVHQTEACLNLLTAVGVHDFIKDTTIPIPSEQRDSAYKFLISNGLNPGNKIAVFNISNNRKTSTWQSANFIKLGKLLFENNGFRCIITCILSDRDKAIKICNEMKGNALFYETRHIMNFAAMVSMANFLIAGDGGAVHISASVGTPVVALFGQTNPAIYGPCGGGHIVLMSPNGDVNSITADTVFSAVRSGGRCLDMAPIKIIDYSAFGETIFSEERIKMSERKQQGN